MPLHFQSITNDDQNPSLLAALLADVMEECDSVFVSPDKYIHMQKKLVNSLSGQEFGKIVYTLKINDENDTIMVIDLDIMLNGKTRSVLCFNKLLSGSSDSNEYYEAEISDAPGHLEIETVNRHTVARELTGTEFEVCTCAFPFELNVFSDMGALNRYVGFPERIEVGNTGIKVGGLSDKFIMPGGVLSGSKSDDEHYSFVIGTVNSFFDVRWELDELSLDFIIANVDTALGEIPVAMSSDVFDLSELAVGSVIGMNADIKVDVSNPEVFTVKA